MAGDAAGVGGAAAAPPEEEEEWRDWGGGVPADVLRRIVAKLADTAYPLFVQKRAVYTLGVLHGNVLAARADRHRRASGGDSFLIVTPQGSAAAKSRSSHGQPRPPSPSTQALSACVERGQALSALYALGSVCKEWQRVQRQALGGPLCVWALKNLLPVEEGETGFYLGVAGETAVLREVVHDAAALGAPREVWDFLGPRCQIGRELTAHTSALAAAGGHLETLQRLRAEGCPWDTRTCDAAVERGRVEVLRWALEAGCPLQRQKATLVAARNGDVNVLALLRSFDCPFDGRTCAAAAGGGRLEAVQWLRAQGCPWDSGSVRAAERHGHPDVLQWLRENGCPEHQVAYSVDARFGSGG